MAESNAPPLEIGPPQSPRKYWTRSAIAGWLQERLSEDVPSLVGIDHGFSFPMQYFRKYKLPLDWTLFLEDFRYHWPTDGQHTYVCLVRDGDCGNGAARTGSSRWRRLAEVRSKAKSVFHFDAPGSVAHSTHAGLPWLLHLRRAMRDQVHFWPFDGWDVPTGRSVVAEAYPALWSKIFPRGGRNNHQQDAYAVAEWMRRAGADGMLDEYFHPELTDGEREMARIEGWILGVD